MEYPNRDSAYQSMARITVELFTDKAPKSVENFLQYAR